MIFICIFFNVGDKVIDDAAQKVCIDLEQYLGPIEPVAIDDKATGGKLRAEPRQVVAEEELGIGRCF